jgi:hypothetical protein
MNHSFNAPRAPIESGMTLRTPHLVTTIDLENPGATVRAGFGIIRQKSRGGQNIRVTDMFDVSL